MKNVFPFLTGSEFTSSYALNTEYTNNVEYYRHATTASFADTIIGAQSGSEPDVNICTITYEQYLQILNGSAVEDCLSEDLSFTRLASC